MAITTNEIYSTLNDLIQTCKDGEEGFRAAAQGVQNSEFRTLFQEYAQQRSKFSSELQSIVSRLGGRAEGFGQRRRRAASWMDEHQVGRDGQG